MSVCLRIRAGFGRGFETDSLGHMGQDDKKRLQYETQPVVKVGGVVEAFAFACLLAAAAVLAGLALCTNYGFQCKVTQTQSTSLPSIHHVRHRTRARTISGRNMLLKIVFVVK